MEGSERKRKKKKWERRRKKHRSKKGERKMARLLVKAEIVQSARASFISEAEAHTARTTHYLQYSSCLSLIPSSGTPAIIHQCFSVTVMHTHMCTHVRTRNAPSTSLSQRPRCPIRRQWRGDTVFARACQTDTTSPASKAPNTPIIFLPT